MRATSSATACWLRSKCDAVDLTLDSSCRDDPTCLCSLMLRGRGPLGQTDNDKAVERRRAMWRRLSTTETQRHRGSHGWNVRLLSEVACQLVRLWPGLQLAIGQPGTSVLNRQLAHKAQACIRARHQSCRKVACQCGL